MITDLHLLSEEPHPAGFGTLRKYRYKNRGLSLINGSIFHSYPFAWEAAVLDEDGHLDYTTPLTSDVEVFSTDEEANEFIERAFAWFELNPGIITIDGNLAEPLQIEGPSE